MSVDRPIPIRDAETAPFWAATREHRLVVQRCLDCQHPRLYPRELCPRCGSARSDWLDSRGTGAVYSFTVVHRPPSPAFAADVPYVLAIVALDEGPHMMTNVVGCAPSDVRVGQRVRVRFRDLDDLALPLFEPEPA